jgi:hypothetical protein
MLTSSTLYATFWPLLRIFNLAGEESSADVVKKRFSITNNIDSTAKSPKTSIRLETRSRQEFLIDLDL